MPEDGELANRFNRLWTNDGGRILQLILVAALPVAVSLIAGLKPNGYFLSAVMFLGISMNTVADRVRRSCFLADSGVGGGCFAGALESP
jgi:hypothetical protein